MTCQLFGCAARAGRHRARAQRLSLLLVCPGLELRHSALVWGLGVGATVAGSKDQTVLRPGVGGDGGFVLSARAGVATLGGWVMDTRRSERLPRIFSARSKNLKTPECPWFANSYNVAITCLNGASREPNSSIVPCRSQPLHGDPPQLLKKTKKNGSLSSALT